MPRKKKKKSNKDTFIEQLEILEQGDSGEMLLEYLSVIAETLVQADIQELDGAEYSREFRHKRWKALITINNRNNFND